MSESKNIDGKAFAEGMRRRIAAEVQEIKAEKNMVPGLAVVLVGEDPASQVYVRNKARQTAEARHALVRAPAARDHLAKPSCWRWSRASTPIPRSTASWCSCRCPTHIDPRKVIDADRPGQGRRRLPRRSTPAAWPLGQPALVPCTPLGCLMLLRGPARPISRACDAVVVGRSNIVGKPMAQLLLAGELHRHHRPFAHARPAGRVPPRRHPCRRRRPAGDGPRRLDQARRRGDRRRHQPRASATAAPKLVGDVAFDEVEPQLPARSRRCPAASAR